MQDEIEHKRHQRGTKLRSIVKLRFNEFRIVLISQLFTHRTFKFNFNIKSKRQNESSEISCATCTFVVEHPRILVHNQSKNQPCHNDQQDAQQQQKSDATLLYRTRTK